MDNEIQEHLDTKNEKVDDTLKESLDNAQKAKEGNRKTEDKPADNQVSDEEKDAEKWRNEG